MKADELVEAIDQLKAVLMAEIRSNGSSGYSPDEYRELRATLKQHPELQVHLPEWLRRAASLREVVSRIRDEAGDEHGWRRLHGP